MPAWRRRSLHTARQPTTTPPSYRPTVGVDFYGARLALPADTPVSAQLWDVGAAMRSLTMAANYISGCDAVLMVHDLSQRQVGARAGRARVARTMPLAG